MVFPSLPSLRCKDIAEDRTDIGVQDDGPLLDPLPGVRLPEVHAGVYRIAVVRSHLQERDLDYPGRVPSDAELHKEDALAVRPVEEFTISAGCLVPPSVLHEPAVDAEIGDHPPPASGTAGDELRGYAHVLLLGGHPAHGGLVIVRLLRAGDAALEEPIVALGVEQPLLIETGQLELVVHIGGQDEVVPAFHQFQEVGVRLPGSGVVTVDANEAAPPGPVLLLRRERVEPAAVHVADAVLGPEIREVIFEAFPSVVEPGGSREAGTSADDDGVRVFQGAAEPLYLPPVPLGAVLLLELGQHHRFPAPRRPR